MANSNETSGILADTGTAPGTTEARARPYVMVVDDDGDVREALKLFLGRTYEVILCSGGAEAVRRMEEHIDVVILDMKMQPHDGIWVYRALREIDATVPIVFNSGYQNLMSDQDVKDHCQPFAYLNKGESATEVLDVIARAVRQRSSLRARSKAKEQLDSARKALNEVG